MNSTEITYKQGQLHITDINEVFNSIQPRVYNQPMFRNEKGTGIYYSQMKKEIYNKRCIDLFMKDIIDDHKYRKLAGMINSPDEENFELAKQIINNLENDTKNI